MTALTLPLAIDLTDVHFTDEQFYQLCIHNPDLNVERDMRLDRFMDESKSFE